jgi:hypothetical protein
VKETGWFFFVLACHFEGWQDACGVPFVDGDKGPRVEVEVEVEVEGEKMKVYVT